MPLSAAPTFTPGSAGNVVAASATVTNGTAVTATFAIGLSGDSGAQGTTTTGSAIAGRLQIWVTATSVSWIAQYAAAGVRAGRTNLKHSSGGRRASERAPDENARRCALGKAGRRSAPRLITRRSRSPPVDRSLGEGYSSPLRIGPGPAHAPGSSACRRARSCDFGDRSARNGVRFSNSARFRALSIIAPRLRRPHRRPARRSRAAVTIDPPFRSRQPTTDNRQRTHSLR